jgi:hypothetical protein
VKPLQTAIEGGRVIAALSSAARLSASYCTTPPTRINGTHWHTSERDRHAPNSVATVFQLLRADKLVAAMARACCCVRGKIRRWDRWLYTHPAKNMPWLWNARKQGRRSERAEHAASNQTKGDRGCEVTRYPRIFLLPIHPSLNRHAYEYGRLLL